MARKDPSIPKQTKKFMKEDAQYEFDELIDAILSLNSNELNEMLRTVKSDRLYHLIQTYKNWWRLFILEEDIQDEFHEELYPKAHQVRSEDG